MVVEVARGSVRTTTRRGPRPTSGVELVGGLGLWLAGMPAERVACVTGTKGKSTTASIAGALAAELLAPRGESCLAGGNLGTPPWDPAVPIGRLVRHRGLELPGA